MQDSLMMWLVGYSVIFAIIAIFCVSESIKVFNKICDLTDSLCTLSEMMENSLRELVKNTKKD